MSLLVKAFFNTVPAFGSRAAAQKLALKPHIKGQGAFAVLLGSKSKLSKDSATQTASVTATDSAFSFVK